MVVYFIYTIFDIIDKGSKMFILLFNLLKMFPKDNSLLYEFVEGLITIKDGDRLTCQ